MTAAVAPRSREARAGSQLALLLALAVFINYVDRGNLATAAPRLARGLPLARRAVVALADPVAHRSGAHFANASRGARERGSGSLVSRHRWQTRSARCGARALLRELHLLFRAQLAAVLSRQH